MDLFDHGCKPLQAWAGAVNAVGHSLDCVAEYPRSIGLRNARLFEFARDRVAEAMEANTLTFQTERD